MVDSMKQSFLLKPEVLTPNRNGFMAKKKWHLKAESTVYARAALAWTKSNIKRSLLKQTELQKEQRKERLTIRREKDRERRRTKKLQEEKKRSSETEDHGKQRLTTLKN